MDINLIIEYLKTAGVVPNAVHKEDSAFVYSACYFMSKPKEHKADSYITCNYRTVKNGFPSKHIVTLTICAVDPLEAVELKKRVLNALDFRCKYIPIAHMVKFALNSEDELRQDLTTGVYTAVVRYDVNYL